MTDRECSAADLRASVLARVAAAPSRTRSEGKKRALLLYGIAASGMLAVFELAGGLAHSAARPLRITAWIAAGAAILALFGTVAAIGRRSMTGPRAPALVAAVALLPVGVLAWLTSWNQTYVQPENRFGLRCLGLALAMGALLFGALLAVRMRASPLRPRLSGAALGAVSGAWASVLVDVWCPITLAPHVLFGHALPMAILSLAGAFVGNALLAVRAR